MKNILLATILAAVIAIPFFGNLDLSTTISANDNKSADIKYSPVPAGNYNLDTAHSLIGFSVRHLEINWVQGQFKDFKGVINFNDKDITKSLVEFSAKIESIDTEIAPRDTHLKSPDFFDAAKYPELKFTSTKIQKKGKDTYILFGDFTLKGVTKQISFPFTITGAVKDPWGNTRFGIEAHTKINRRDYGINYGNAFAGGFDVGNEVTINLLLEAVKPAPKN